MRPLSIASLLFVTIAAFACGCGGETNNEDDTDGAPQAWDAESATDETKSTHLFVVNRAIDILAKHTADVPSAANTIAWLRDDQCRAAWQDGLLQADFLAPFNAAATDLALPDGTEQTSIEALEANFEVATSHASWMNHFYDPGSKKNYEGLSLSGELVSSLSRPFYGQIKAKVEVNGPVPMEAKGAALFRLARAMQLLGGTDVPASHPNEPRALRPRGCYELGLALHYITDLTQPMHAANFAATDRPRLLHSNWEGWAGTIQGRFVQADWSGDAPKGDPASAIEDAAVAARARWTSLLSTDVIPGPLFQAVLDAYAEGSTWSDSGAPDSDVSCRAAGAEQSAAGFISVDLAKCWRNNPKVVEETGRALSDAQAHAARVLATFSLPPH